MFFKKMRLPLILFAAELVIGLVLSIILFGVTAPEIKKEEFPYSITYEYNGETKTINDTYCCEFKGANAFSGEKTRY